VQFDVATCASVQYHHGIRDRQAGDAGANAGGSLVRLRLERHAITPSSAMRVRSIPENPGSNRMK
jgi:hypothetical protein